MTFYSFIQTNPAKGKGKVTGKNGVDRLSRWTAASDSNRNNKNLANGNRINVSMLSTDEYNSRRTEIIPTDVALLDQVHASLLVVLYLSFL